MKIFNTIIVWDVYVVAEDEKAAHEAAMQLIQTDDLPASHRATNPVALAPIRPQWRDERPIVAADVSAADFERLRGKTTQQVHDLLFKKERKA